jgi:hypothetical protein
MDKCITSRGGKSPHRTLYLTEENNEWLSEQMRRRIDSPEGKELYSHRMGIIEPCFANEVRSAYGGAMPGGVRRRRGTGVRTAERMLRNSER